MTTSQIPIELQASQAKLQALRKPHEPVFNDTVKASESAFEGESVIGLAIYAMLPWWLEDFASGGGSGDENETKDYLIGVPLAAVTTALYFGLSGNHEWWEVFAFSMMAAAATFLALIAFHLIFHKCISMFIYNRLFRRSWMKKMRLADEQNYREDVASYPHRLQEYETARENAFSEATAALRAYHATNPSIRYSIGEYGFKQVSNLETAFNMVEGKVRGIFGRLLNR